MRAFDVALMVPILMVMACAAAGSAARSSDGDAGAQSGDTADGVDSSSSSGRGGSSSGASSSDASTIGSSSGGGLPIDGGNSSGGPESGAFDTGVAPDCRSLALCDDFESDVPNAPPSATLWSVVDGRGCSGSSSYSVVVDNMQHHGSGSQSVRITGGDSCGPLMVNASGPRKLSSGEVYGRFYVLFASVAAVHHAAFMTLGFQADAGPLGNNTQQYLQLSAEEAGGTDGATVGMLDWNFNDLTLPQKDSAGVAQTTYPAAAAWTCIEFHTSAMNGGIETWVNGAPVAGMTYRPGVTADVQGVNGGWNSGRPPLSIQSLGFGWVDFTTSTTTIWIDDVALSATRVGCL